MIAGKEWIPCQHIEQEKQTRFQEKSKSGTFYTFEEKSNSGTFFLTFLVKSFQAQQTKNQNQQIINKPVNERDRQRRI